MGTAIGEILETVRQKLPDAHESILLNTSANDEYRGVGEITVTGGIRRR